MRNFNVVVLTFFGVWCAISAPAAQSAQLPVASALLEHRVVLLTGPDMESLIWAADEIRKLNRFELTGDREDAELVFTVFRVERTEGPEVVQLSGNDLLDQRILTEPSGAVTLPTHEPSVRLVVHDKESGTLLWDDSRKISWRASEALKDVVRDLHKAIDQAGHP